MIDCDDSSHGDWVDWVEYVKTESKKIGDRFDLTQVQAGDVLRITTAHTAYLLRMKNSRDGDLTTDRPDRPQGRVRIVGCTLGLSSSIMANHLFCGGSLEFTFVDGQDRMTHTTTAIRKIEWRREG
jgi:hypothetical protein